MIGGQGAGIFDEACTTCKVKEPGWEVDQKSLNFCDRIEKLSGPLLLVLLEDAFIVFIFLFISL